MRIRALFAALALLPALAFAGPADDAQFMTLPEYRHGLNELRGYFEKRGEDPTVAERYIADLEAAFLVNPGERVPVTKGTFAAFLKYQAAWARKTRNAKNPNVSATELNHEIGRAGGLKGAFKKAAEADSPRFYRAFQAAVQDVRSLRRRGNAYAGASSVFFSDQVDDSYTHVDAGDEALEKGDSTMAIQEANLALGVNPANADALVLRAGAQYDRRKLPEAITDAQAALVLDPGNIQAKAILSLTQGGPASADTALKNAAAGSEGLATDGGRQLPKALVTDDGGSQLGELKAISAQTASATPAVGRILASDLSIRAVSLAPRNPRESQGQLGQAMALDPTNASARDWYSTVANRRGDYSAALGSAEAGLKADPQDAIAYYNKAYALAGRGDKAGMVDALQAAAKIDPVYRTASVRAEDLSDKEALELLFGNPAETHQPAAPQPRRPESSPILLMLGAVGALLAILGAAVFFASSGARGPQIVRR